MQDDMIIALYYQRDEQAIVQTNAKYGAYCTSIAQNILHNMQDSEECVNDTWLCAWNSMPPANPPILRTYLGRITRNFAINRYKKQHRQKRGGHTVEAIAELGDIASPETEVQAQMDKQELARVFNAFLYSLPERDCNVFLRRYFYAESAQEIAKRYGLKQDNVLKILSRTRQKLKEYLKKEGIWL